MIHLEQSSEEAAVERSRALWLAILGREKHSDDVTEYLFGVAESAIIVHERDEYLDRLLREDEMTADELAALVSLYPAWSGGGVVYGVDDLVGYGGTLWRCVQAHTSQADWAPGVAVSLWAGSSPGGVIPEWVQPTGAHDAYALGARVVFGGQVWESTVGANVWAPGVFGWVEVEA